VEGDRFTDGRVDEIDEASEDEDDDRSSRKALGKGAEPAMLGGDKPEGPNLRGGGV
jgi:hypothetical protein